MSYREAFAAAGHSVPRGTVELKRCGDRREAWVAITGTAIHLWWSDAWDRGATLQRWHRLGWENSPNLIDAVAAAGLLPASISAGIPDHEEIAS